jgi:voltage-gated potassium channel
MRGQTLVVGFGVAGSTAASYLHSYGTNAVDLLAVDVTPEAVQPAGELGVPAILGDGTDRHVLARAVSDQVRQVIVAVTPNETAIMTTMLARELCPSTTIATAVRESPHPAVVRHHGADLVRNDRRYWGIHATRLRVTSGDRLVFLRPLTPTET